MSKSLLLYYTSRNVKVQWNRETYSVSTELEVDVLLSFQKKSSSAKLHWFAAVLCVSAPLSSEQGSAARYPCCRTRCLAGSFSVAKLTGTLSMCKFTALFGHQYSQSSRLHFHNPFLPSLQFNTKKKKSHSSSIFFSCCHSAVKPTDPSSAYLSLYRDAPQRTQQKSYGNRLDLRFLIIFPSMLSIFYAFNLCFK